MAYTPTIDIPSSTLLFLLSEIKPSTSRQTITLPAIEVLLNLHSSLETFIHISFSDLPPLCLTNNFLPEVRIIMTPTIATGDTPVTATGFEATNATETSGIHSGASSNSIMSGSSNGSLHDSVGHPHHHTHHHHHHPHNTDETAHATTTATTTSTTTSNGNPSTNSHPHVKNQQNVVFIHKLYDILENKDLAHLIWWSGNGLSFFIKPNEQFSKTLAKYFKHTNITSFVRQLNIYGFHKVTNLNESSSSMAEKERHNAEVAAAAVAAAASMNSGHREVDSHVVDNVDTTTHDSQDVSAIKIWEFKHSAGIFKRGDRESLKYIKRRSSSRNNSNINRKKLNLLSGAQGMPGVSGSAVHSHSNLASSVEYDSNEHLGILRSNSSFTPYSSSDNMINMQNPYGQSPGQPCLIPNVQQHQTGQNLAAQTALRTTNEFMMEQFNSLNNDMMQVLNVLQNFVTLQNSVAIHETPTKPIMDNFQNQYNLLYHNISNLKNDLVNKYQSISTSFYEQQQYIQQQQAMGQQASIMNQPVQYTQTGNIPQGYTQSGAVYIPQQTYVSAPQLPVVQTGMAQQPQAGIILQPYQTPITQQAIAIQTVDRNGINGAPHIVDRSELASTVGRDLHGSPQESGANTGRTMRSRPSVNSQLLNPVAEAQETPEQGMLHPEDDSQKLSIPASPALTTVAYAPGRKLSSATSLASKLNGSVQKPEIQTATSTEPKAALAALNSTVSTDTAVTKNSKVYSLLNNSDATEIKEEHNGTV